MAALDTVSIGILLGSVVVLAGILSSVVALRFGAPLLLVFLLLGVFAGEAGPGGIKFDDVGTAYIVGSVALALILFDGGLHTRFATFRSVLAPAGLLATVGVLVTAFLTAPIAKFALGLGWIEGLLAEAIAERLGVDVRRELRPRVLAAAACAAERVAIGFWLDSDARVPLAEVLAQAIRQVVR